MAEFRKMDRASLLAHPDYNEDMVQQYIFENPEVLNLGNVTGLKREKKQQAGGFVDIILGDDDTRYEVEIQLGRTDPSHIIRTIEYWDNERWRYPQFNHVAVLIAEEITGRFFNVISLFNKHIPLIAYQMTAFRTDDGEMILTFSKVLDLVTREPDDDSPAKIYDYDYWVKKVGQTRMDDVIKIFQDLFDETYRLHYTKSYVGVPVNYSRTYFTFIYPSQKFIKLRIYTMKTDECDAQVSKIGEYCKGYYNIQVNSYEDYMKHRDGIRAVVKAAAKESGKGLCYDDENGD